MPSPEESEAPFPHRRFDPRSGDAMFATILERLSQQDGKLEAIHADVRKTNGRVTALETWRAVVKGKLALISAGVSGVVGFVAWLIENWPDK